jgi:membrane protein
MRAELSALRKRGLRRGFSQGWDAFFEYDLLTYASAIAFQILYAVLPLILLGLSGLGLFGLRSVYTAHIAPTLRHDLSHDSFAIANRTALRVMGAKRYWWATIGLAVTLWGVGASLRAMTTPLNNVYGAKEHRGYKERLATSIGGGALVTVALFAAIVVVLGGRLVHPPGVVLAVLFFVGRWVVTFGLLLVTIATIIRFVPAKKRPVEWVSIGSIVCAVCWIVATLGFAAYISAVSYTSFYGAFASIVMLLIYLHLAAVAFLIGVVVDAQLRQLVDRSGGSHRRKRVAKS